MDTVDHGPTSRSMVERQGRCDNCSQKAIDEISVKSLFGTLSGIARCASKLIYCAVTVLRDRIRVPDEF
jgi:hypothetical protein